MKGNIKKLSVLVGVLVVALFMVVAMVSADPAIHHGIEGLYAVTGFTSCSPTGQGIMEADYTFSNDGSGSVSGTIRIIEAGAFPAGGSSLNITDNFTYTVTKEGRIEFAYPSGGFNVFLPDGTYLMTWDSGPSHGVISPDGKTITISCGPPVYLMVLGPNGKPLSGTGTYCLTTAVGMRMTDHPALPDNHHESD